MPKEKSQSNFPLHLDSEAGTIEDPSTRTSFAFSEEATETLSLLAQLAGSLKEAFNLVGKAIPSIDKAEIEIPSAPEEKKIERTRKTYVINRRTLNIINRASKEYGIKRDLFLESVLKPTLFYFVKTIEERNKERLERQKKAQKLIDELVDYMLEKEKELDEMLGENDPICDAFDELLVTAEAFIGMVDHLLKDGKPIYKYFRIFDSPE